MFEDDLLFIECGGYVVPHLWEDGRLDFLSRRRFEAEAHYDRMIAQYEHELERIRCDLRRNPSDHSLHHMEDLYRNRLAEAKRKKEEIIAELRDEERRHAEKLHAHQQAEERSRQFTSNHRGYMMYGFGAAAA